MESLSKNETYEQMKAREALEENVALDALQALCASVAAFCANNDYLRPCASERAVSALEHELRSIGIGRLVFKTSQPRRQLPRSLRTTVLERDAYRCVKCGDWHDLTIDHKTPVAMNGTDDVTNLQTLCRKCNCSKGGRV